MKHGSSEPGTRRALSLSTGSKSSTDPSDNATSLGEHEGPHYSDDGAHEAHGAHEAQGVHNPRTEAFEIDDPLATDERTTTWLDSGRVHLSVLDPERPSTYGDCLREGWGDHEATGPCPWVSCAHHLAWGRAKVAKHSPVPGSPELVEAVAELDLDEMPHTCALRVADEGATLADIGAIFGTSRERIRQVESECLDRLSHKSRAQLLATLKDEGHAIERPDLQADRDDNEPRATRDELIARAVLDATMAANDNAPRASRRPAVRVLVGEERERRITELHARKPRARRFDAALRPDNTICAEPLGGFAADRATDPLDRFSAHAPIEMIDELEPRTPTLAELLR